MLADPPHIAVVEDEEPVRVALGRVLQWSGLEVRTFASVEEILASVAWADCVVLDLHMPGMSGFDVLPRLAAEAERPPVIVITGRDSAENRQRSMAAGAVAYLLKPVDGAGLLDAISTAVSPRKNVSPPNAPGLQTNKPTNDTQL